MASRAGAIRAGRAFVELFADDSLLQRGLKRAQARLRAFGSSIQHIGAKLFAAGAGIAGAFIPAITAASNLEEVMNKFNVVFGDNADSVKQFTDDLAEELGRSKRQMAEFMAEAQDLFVPLGFDPQAATDLSKQVTQLSVDLASFNNMADADVMRDLKAALTGSGEVMKKYGVIVSEAAVKQELLNQGMNPQTATDQQKVLARLNIILRGTTAAQGDAVRSGGSFANQLKRLKGYLEDMAAEIGQAVLPMVTQFINRTGEAVKFVVDWVRENGGLIATIFQIGAAVAAAGALLIGLGTAIQIVAFSVGGLSTGVSALGAVLGVLLSPVGMVTAAIAGLGAVILTQTDAGAKAVQFLEATFGPLAETATRSFAAIRDALAAGEIGRAAEILWSTLKLAFATGITFIKTQWIDLKATMLNAFVDLWSKLPEGWQTAIKTMLSAFITFGNEVRSIWRSAQNSISKGFLHLMKLFDDSIDVAAASEELNQMFQHDIARYDRQAANAKRNLQQQLDKFAEDPEAAKADIRRSADKERARLQAELNRSKRELERLIAEGNRTPAVAAKPDLKQKQQQAGEAASQIASGRGAAGLASVQATSAEGLRIIAETLRRGGRDPNAETAKNTKQILAEEQQQTALLQASLAGLKVVSIGVS